MIHITSLMPRDLDHQLACLETWRPVARAIHTVNHPREAALLDGRLPQWVSQTVIPFGTPYGRFFLPLPALAEAVKRAASGPDDRVSLANSDITLGDERAIAEAGSDPASLVFASRMDVDDQGEALGTYRDGFDWFRFHAADAPLLAVEGAALGLPWWDYVLPLVFLRAERPVRRLDHNHAILHRRHDQRWSPILFYYTGARFARAFGLAREDADLSEDFLLAFAKEVAALLNGPDLGAGQGATSEPLEALRRRMARLDAHTPSATRIRPLETCGATRAWLDGALRDGPRRERLRHDLTPSLKLGPGAQRRGGRISIAARAAGHALFGPYLRGLEPGRYRATLAYAAPASAALRVAFKERPRFVFEVVLDQDEFLGQVSARPAVFGARSISIEFTLGRSYGSDSELETRLWVSAGARLTVFSVELARV